MRRTYKFVLATATSAILALSALPALAVSTTLNFLASPVNDPMPEFIYGGGPGGSLTTGAPAGGTAGAWKLGIRVAAASVLDTTQYLQVDIGGTAYKLALAA